MDVFLRRVARAMERLRASLDAALQSKAAAGRAARAKSTPAASGRLRARIVERLRKAGEPCSAQDLFAALRLRESDRGRLTYALDRLKTEGTVFQVGSRRTARYAVMPVERA